MSFRRFIEGTGPDALCSELGNEDTRREVCKYQTRQEEVSEPRFSSLAWGQEQETLFIFLSFSLSRGNIFYEERSFLTTRH